MKGFVLRMAIGTPIFSVLLGLLTGNPHWYWNIPLGVGFGILGGLILWWPTQKLVDWLDRRDDHPRETRRERS